MEAHPGDFDPSRIAIGTSGFSYEDWRGAFYPLTLPKRQFLAFYAMRYGILEVNSPYYRLVPARSYAGMLKNVPDDFEFVVKVLGDFTHKPGLDMNLVQQYRDSLKPLMEANQLTALLAQFPWSFRNNPRNQDKLRAMADVLGDLKLAVEFRHDSWLRPEIDELLEQYNLPFVSVDEPQLQHMLPPVAKTTAGLAYVRFHGRNAKDWWGDSGGDRYNYLYSEAELQEWIPRLKELIRGGNRVMVFFNNCCMGQAVRNAEMLQKMLGVEPRHVPQRELF